MNLLSLWDWASLGSARASNVLGPWYFQTTFVIARGLGLFPGDYTPREMEIVARVRPYTMTSTARVVAAIRAAEYVAKNEIPGALVECGVWRGGSMMAFALALLKLGRADRPLYLFDTFGGMSEPFAADGPGARKKWRRNQRPTHNDWCYASLADVQRNVRSTGYDENLVHFVEGRIEETVPSRAPAQIALLRLDTDWHESTRHELEHLYPRLASGGVLIIDDYERWPGCRRAVDEYIERNRLRLFLSRIDYTGRIAVKP